MVLLIFLDALHPVLLLFGMIVLTYYFIWFVLVLHERFKGSYSLKVRRDIFDRVEESGLGTSNRGGGGFNCDNITAAVDKKESKISSSSSSSPPSSSGSGSSSSCVCSTTGYPTFMSPFNTSHASCKHSSDLQCTISLATDDDASTANDKKEVKLEDNLVKPVLSLSLVTRPTLKEHCAEIKNIFLWNFISGKGSWTDVTDSTRSLFKLSRDSVFTISSEDMSIWSGHLFMIRLTCHEYCLIVKFKGFFEYPFLLHKVRMTAVSAQDESGGGGFADNPELGVTAIIVISAATVLLLVILVAMCIFRQKLPCREQSSWPGRTSSGVSTNKIHVSLQEYHSGGGGGGGGGSSSAHGSDIELCDKDPWYQVAKLSHSQTGQMSGHMRKPSADSFYIPTIKGFFRERNTRTKNVCDMSFSPDQSVRLPPSQQVNPYQETASSY